MTIIKFFLKILHGEQYIEILEDMPTDGVLTTKGSIIELLDKKSGAVAVSNRMFVITFFFLSKTKINQFLFFS